MQVWLEIDEKAHQDVQVEPDGHVTRAFRWGQDGVTATDDEIAKDARVVYHIRQSTPIDPNALPSTVPSEWRDQHWSLLVPRLRPGERVIDQRFTLLELHSVDVVYAVGPIEQTISLEGLRLLAPPASVDTAFARRARHLRTAAWSLAAVPIVLALFYLARGAWFWSVETAILCGLVALASALTYIGISRASIPRRGAWLWLSATVVPLVAGLVVALGLEPDLDRARARALAGDFDGARAELGAAGDSPVQALAAHEVQVAELLTIDDVDRASTMLAALEKANPETRPPTELTNARAHVYALHLRAADADLGLEDFDAARARLMALPQSERSRPEAKALLGKIDHASDQHALSAAEQAFAANDLTAFQASLAAMTPEMRRSEAVVTLERSTLIRQARLAFESRNWLESLTAARTAHGLRPGDDTSALMAEICIAMDKEAQALVMQATPAKSPVLDQRLERQRLARAMLTELATHCDKPNTKELGLLVARHDADLAALAKRDAAAEAKRKKEAELAEAKRIAEAKRLEARRVAEAKRAEARRLAEEQRLERERLARQRAAERSYQPSYGGRQCVRGCPCGNACISCSKRCRR